MMNAVHEFMNVLQLRISSYDCGVLTFMSRRRIEGVWERDVAGTEVTAAIRVPRLYG